MSVFGAVFGFPFKRAGGFAWKKLACVVQVLFDKKLPVKNETNNNWEVIDESGDRDGEVLESNIGLFDSTLNNYVSELYPIYSDTPDVKIEFDFKIASAVSSTEAIYTEGHSITDTGWFKIGVSSGNSVNLNLFNDAGTSLIGTSASISSYVDNKKHTLTYLDNNGVYSLSIDGNEIISGTYTPSGTVTFDLASIGALVRTSDINHFQGIIANLTQSRTNDTLLHSYHIDDADGTDIRDYIDTDPTHGVLNNAVLRTFWTTDNEFKSYQNEVGYSEGGVMGNNLTTSFINGTSFPFTTFNWDGSTITAIKPLQPAFEGCASNNIGTAYDGDLFILTYTLTLNSGVEPEVMLAPSQSGYAGAVSDIKMLSQGSNSLILTKTGTHGNTYLQIRLPQTNISNFTLSNIIFKRFISSTVLIPAQINSAGELNGRDAIGNDLQYKGQIRLNDMLYSPCIAGDTIGKIYFNASQDGDVFNWRNTVDQVLTPVTYSHSTGWLIPSNTIDYVIFDTVGEYHFDERTGATIDDYSGSGYDATITGGTLSLIRTDAKNAYPWKTINLRGLIEGQSLESYPSNQMREADEAISPNRWTDGSGNFIKVPWSTFNAGNGNFDDGIIYDKNGGNTSKIITFVPNAAIDTPKCWTKAASFKSKYYVTHNGIVVTNNSIPVTNTP